MVAQLLGCVLLVLASVIASHGAENWQGKVAAVTSGNSLSVQDSQGETRQLRLYGIDAPDNGQANADYAREMLSAMVLNKEVAIRDETSALETVPAARVFLGEVSINAAMVKAGCAWVYEPSCKLADCKTWLAYQQFARSNGKGLWVDSGAEPPWKWRERRMLAEAKAKEINTVNQYATYYGSLARGESVSRASAPSVPQMRKRSSSSSSRPATGGSRKT